MSDQFENQNLSVAVLLPCYNEEVTIGKVVRDFKASLPDATIYVYDNNSTDRTAEIAEAEGAIVRREPRQGKGNVIRAMFEDIDADVYVMADGDDTYPAGYRAFNFTFVKTYPVLSRGFEVETEMTIHSLNNNLRLFEMPIQYRDRPEGSVSKLDTVGDGIKVMSTIFRMIREYKPLPFFGGLGLIIGIVGIVLCGTVTFEFAKTGVVTHFPTLIGAVMLVIAGLLLIIAGIILDVMAKNDRKTFVIDTNKIAYNKRH